MTAEPIAYDLSGPTDGVLAHDHLSGADQQAFAELYRRYYPRLVRHCVRRTGDTFLAEDVAQETLVRALRYLGGFDTSRPMWPWLKTIASRIAYQSAQKTASERCSDLDQEDPEAYAVESPCHRIDDQLVLTAALDKVPARQRAALVMRYVDDWSTADSARFAGMTIPAFEQLLFRARRRLCVEYRRLTETRRPGMLGLLPLALVRRLRSLRGLRIAGTSTVGSGMLGLATMGLAVTVMTSPATTVPRLATENGTRVVTATESMSRFHASEVTFRHGLEAASTRGRAWKLGDHAGSADHTTHMNQNLGPVWTDTDVDNSQLSPGKKFSVKVHVKTPVGEVIFENQYERGSGSVECNNLRCGVKVHPTGYSREI